MRPSVGPSELGALCDCPGHMPIELPCLEPQLRVTHWWPPNPKAGHTQWAQEHPCLSLGQGPRAAATALGNPRELVIDDISAGTSCPSEDGAQVVPRMAVPSFYLGGGLGRVGKTQQ